MLNYAKLLVCIWNKWDSICLYLPIHKKSKKSTPVILRSCPTIRIVSIVRPNSLKLSMIWYSFSNPQKIRFNSATNSQAITWHITLISISIPKVKVRTRNTENNELPTVSLRSCENLEGYFLTRLLMPAMTFRRTIRIA